MGGERETQLESKVVKQVVLNEETDALKMPINEKIKIRTHESNGEVHFHDDLNKLKCAVPCADWYKAWNDLRKVSVYDSDNWSYVDVKNQTVLLIESAAEIQDGQVNVNVNIEIRRAIISGNFESLEKFTKG